MVSWASVGVLLVCLCARVTSATNCTTFHCLKLLSQEGNGGDALQNVDMPIPVDEYIRQMGYPVESHEITTEDGYILTYHRIPHGKSSYDISTGRKPVLLQHGLLGCSGAWVITDNALAYVLADSGFDVWLGNSRGNTYSRRHVKYDPDKDKDAFWDFSWHEMGYYDLPAAIDYILNVTKHDQLFYIGHSMGTTMYAVLGSTRPEHMDKWYTKSLDIKEVFPYTYDKFWLDQHVCSVPKYQYLCKDVIFAVSGHDEKEWDKASLGAILDYIPAGVSYKTLQHYSQICKNGRPFAPFDYGFVGNLWRYGSPHPPPYNLANAKAPLYMYYGMNDLLAVPEDVHYAVKFLPNVKTVAAVPDDQFNHVDFMWAIDAKTLLFDNLVSTLHNITNHQEY